ncbi:MAG: hypothetical protein ACLP01_25445 [Solirubrobacteraceae bacterium]
MRTLDAAPAPSPDALQQLRKLGEPLHRFLTDSELEAKKAELFRRI